jgi:hypothetical protein
MYLKMLLQSNSGCFMHVYSMAFEWASCTLEMNCTVVLSSHSTKKLEFKVYKGWDEAADMDS